jgi:hypothetical protein
MIENTIKTLPREGQFEDRSFVSTSLMLLMDVCLMLSATSSASSHNVAVRGNRRAALISNITPATYETV